MIKLMNCKINYIEVKIKLKKTFIRNHLKSFKVRVRCVVNVLMSVKKRYEEVGRIIRYPNTCNLKIMKLN